MTVACRTVLLSDSPADKDAFGPHQNLAKSISDLVTSAQGSRVIGLAGKWGAGKSTVISLLRDASATNENIRIFVFDAWAHEGDPLRRNFLERLVDSLVESGWLAKTKWTTLRDELSGRRRVTVEKQIPRPTLFGIIATASLLLVPVGAGLFTDVLDNWSRIQTWRIWTAWSLMLAPIPAVAIAALYAMIRQKPLGDALAVFINPSVQNVTTETSEDPEATSVEFEHFFSRILVDALAQPDRRLIVVLDNLDRVHAETATKVWTALQTFVGAPSSIAHGQQVWFIVPYDKSRVTAPLGHAIEASIADGFIAKRIALELQVPDPVLTDWRQYLVDSLKLALPDHPAADFELVFHVYSALRLQADSAPTPRDLKRFVNQIGSLHRLRGHEFNLADIAYYIALQLSETNIVNHLLTESLPGPRLQGLVSEDVTGALAAMHFGVPEKQARQLLLKGPIEQALSNGDDVRLSSLKNVVGFISVLEQINPIEFASSNQAAIALACLALERVELLASPEFRTTAFFARLRQALLAPQRWNLVSHKIADGLAAALETFGEALGPGIFRRISAVAKDDDTQLQGPDLDRWAEGLRSVLVRMQTSRMTLPEAGSVTVPCAAKHWFVFAQRLAGSDAQWHLAHVAAPPGGFNAVIAAMPSELAQANVIGLQLTPDAIRVLAHTAPDAEWGPLWDQMRTKIQVTDSTEAVATLDLMTAAASEGQSSAESMLQNVASSGWLHHHLDLFLRKRREQAIPFVLALLRNELLLSAPPAVGNSASGHTRLLEFLQQPDTSPELVKAIAAQDVTAFRLQQFVESAQTEPNAVPLASALISELTATHRVAELLPPARVAVEWPQWRHLIGVPPSADAVLGELAAQGLVSAVVSDVFDSSSADLYLALGKLVGWSASDFGSWCAAGLTRISKEEWDQGLRSSSKVVLLALNVAQGGIEVDLGGTYAEGVAQISRTIAISGDVPDLFTSSWPDLRRLCGKSEQYAREAIVGSLVDNAGTASDAFFEVFHDELNDADTLRREHRLVQKLLSPILSSNRLNAIQWATKLFEKHPGFLSELQHAEEFRDLLRSQLAGSDVDPNTREELERLAVATHIPRGEVAES